MNEVELLEELRAGLPGARPEVRAAARARLVARLEHAAQPARPGATPLWRRPRLRLALAGGAVAALLVALPLGLIGGGGEVQPAVARVLHQAAAVAATQEPVEPGPDQFLYSRSRDAYLWANAEWSVLVPSERQVWIAFGTRKGRVRTETGKPRFVSPDQRAQWVAAGSPRLPRAGAVEDTTASGGSGFLDTMDLPTDPVELREMIEAREVPGLGGPPGEAETFTLIGDLLRESYLPPAVRAAIYELTAELPGVELLGEVRDPAGRPGTGVAFVDERRGTRHELIFDPATSALLGERQTVVRPGAYGFEAPVGTTVGYAAYLESRVVDSVGPNAPAGAGGIDTSVGCYEELSMQGTAAIIHGWDPIATCAEVWREGALGDDPAKRVPDLVACTEEGSSIAHVFPASSSEICARFDLVPFTGR